MGIDRRQFIGLGLGLLLSAPGRLRAGPDSYRLLSCRSDHNGKHFLSMTDSSGHRLLDVALPARGHGMALDPEQSRTAVFARRPGRFCHIVDLLNGEVLHKVEAEPHRHFFGHGVFTPDGKTLLCSENAYDSSRGVIGIYDVDGCCRRVGEIPSHGIGPHEIRLLTDGKTLVVANGGIRTHPDMPRVKLNLADMQSDLAYLELSSGRLLHKFQPEPGWHQLSIRHIDVAADDSIAIAMQFEGDMRLTPPLIALQKAAGPMRMLSAPAVVQHRLRNYCGSVAFSGDGHRFAVSSPRGGLVTFWSADGDYLGAHEQADACGISHSVDSPRGFLVSDGGGKVVMIADTLKAASRQFHHDSRWDNHLLTLTG